MKIKFKTMNEFKQYQRKGLSEMRPYVEGEKIKYISISFQDKKNGSPKIGDMIARNPLDHKDQWLVAKKYFDDNLELVSDVSDDKEMSFLDRLIIEHEELKTKTNKLFEYLKIDRTNEIGAYQTEALNLQLKGMNTYLSCLNGRLNDLKK